MAMRNFCNGEASNVKGMKPSVSKPARARSSAGISMVPMLLSDQASSLRQRMLQWLQVCCCSGSRAACASWVMSWHSTSLVWREYARAAHTASDKLEGNTFHTCNTTNWQQRATVQHGRACKCWESAAIATHNCTTAQPPRHPHNKHPKHKHPRL